jgi:hypothetical protein
LHGQTAEIYGRGLYRYDIPPIAVGFRVGDAFTLIAGIPIMLLSLWRYRRGSIRGGVALTGTLMYFLYCYGSLALGAAYNSLLLAYILITMAAFLSLGCMLMTMDRAIFVRLIPDSVPRRGISIFFIVSGIAVFCIWLFLSMLPAWLAGGVPPELASYTTIITFVLDMAFIAPTLVASGALFLRRAPWGYALAPILLVFIDLLGVSLLIIGIAQRMAGVINMGQFVGFVVSFSILTVFALGFSIALFRKMGESAPAAVQLSHPVAGQA